MTREKELIENKYFDNVKNIRISEETKALLICRAKLSDIYNTVSNVVNKTYNKDTDDVFEGFSDKFYEFDHKLMEVISSYVEVISLDRNYTQM